MVQAALHMVWRIQGTCPKFLEATCIVRVQAPLQSEALHHALHHAVYHKRPETSGMLPQFAACVGHLPIDCWCLEGARKRESDRILQLSSSAGRKLVHERTVGPLPKRSNYMRGIYHVHRPLAAF